MSKQVKTRKSVWVYVPPYTIESMKFNLTLFHDVVSGEVWLIWTLKW